VGFISSHSTGNYNVGFAHSAIGIMLLIVTVIQPIIGILRVPKSNESMHKVWKLTHSILGRTSLIFALINIVLGCLMALLNRLAWVILAWLVIVLLSHVILTLAGYADDGSGSGGAFGADVEEGVFKSSDVFKSGTKGGTSALYQNL